MARPTNSERYSPQNQREQLKVLCGEAIVQLRKKIKTADPATLARIITQVSPVVLNDDTQSTADFSLEALSKKALQVTMSIHNSTERQHASETIDTTDETPTKIV